MGLAEGVALEGADHVPQFLQGLCPSSPGQPAVDKALPPGIELEVPVLAAENLPELIRLRGIESAYRDGHPGYVFLIHHDAPGLGQDLLGPGIHRLP
jgi:hypothetical protein